MTAAQWNEKHPVGTKVRYYPILGHDENVETKTRSEAWELGGGDAVVKVEGRAGGVALTNIEVVGA